MSSFAQIASAYRRDFQENAARERRLFAVQRDFKRVVELAALAQKPSGARFSHQRRVPAAALNRCRKILLAHIGELESATNFDELHDLINRLVRPIRGIGELYVYDTAIRIGAAMKLEPRDVYVHAGVRTGAKHLGFDSSRSKIRIGELPREFRGFDAHEIEDILCIYKSRFSGAKPAAARSTCYPPRPPRRC